MRLKKEFSRAGIITLVLSLLPCIQQMALAQGNLVFNGGFDTSSNGISPDGWTLDGGYFNAKDGNPPPDLVMGGGATASQTVDGLTAGNLYTVSGNYEDGGSDTTDISFEVLLNGTAYFETAVPSNLDWQTFSFEYTATSSSADLTLWQTMGSYLSVGDYNVDNIAMYAAPEPPGSSLICVGGIILAFLCKNRKTK